MRKWLLLAVLLVLGASAYGLGEGPGEATWPGRVFGGDTTFNGSVTVAGDGGGARIQLDCNTTAPTYDTGEAGIDCTEEASDVRSKLYFQDDDGNRSMIGHQAERSLFMARDGVIADNSVCFSQWFAVNNNALVCGAYNASTPVPESETWIFHEVSLFVTEALAAATEDCGVWFSYSSTKAAYDDACVAPDCAVSTQIPIALTGPTDPGVAGAEAYWLTTAMDEYTHDLGDVEVSDGGFWRIIVDRRHQCVGGADADLPCWDVTGDTDCDGVGVCTEGGDACSVVQSIVGTVEFSRYR